MHTIDRDHIHMKYIKPFLIISGIWPLPLKGFKELFYNLYFYITYIFFILNVGTLYMATKEIADHGKLAEITKHAANVVFATILIFKAWTYRSKGVKELLELILKTEKKIFETYDKKSRKIYIKNTAAVEFLGAIYIFQGCFTTFCAQFFPLIITLMSKPDENGHIEKYYMVPNWEPFDKYQYYYTAYFIHFLYTSCAETYIVFCGTFFLFILKNVTGQLLVLQHRFANIHKDALRLSRNEGVSFKMACNMFMKDCIKHHQKIIRLVADLDNTFKKFIFVDYVFTSLGLSMVLLEFLLEESVQMKIAAAGFFFAFACQSLITYYHADEVAWESSYGLTQAIFASDLYEIDVTAQKMLVFVIRRAQKPLTLSIGPFRKVGVDSMIALFKATYSYLSLMWR